MAFRKLFLGCKNFFFPPRCLFCRRVLTLSADACICYDCMKQTPFCSDYHTCQGCGRPIPEGAVLCYRCGKGYRRYYRKVFSAYLYEDEPKRAVIRFKHERYQSYAATFAVHMGAVLRERLPGHQFDMVVSVPPRKRRLQKVGYDQAETLGRAMAKELGIPYLAGALCQREVRKKQSTLRYRERYLNVLGNYAVVRAQDVAEKRILLVDDQGLECGFTLIPQSL